MTNPGTMIFVKPNGNISMYKVTSFHIHAPSEHWINGRQYDAEMQIMHQEYQTNETAIISILFDASKDIPSAFMDKLRLNGIPVWGTNTTINTTTTSLVNGRNVTNTTFTNVRNTGGYYWNNLTIPLMDYVQRMGQSFYYYEGSLCTPPCTEKVQWIVMSEIQYITLNDLGNLTKFWAKNPQFAKGRGNNRMIMPRNGRPIYYKHVTLDERISELKNHFMLPSQSTLLFAKMTILTVSLIITHYLY